MGQCVVGPRIQWEPPPLAAASSSHCSVVSGTSLSASNALNQVLGGGLGWARLQESPKKNVPATARVDAPPRPFLRCPTTASSPGRLMLNASRSERVRRRKYPTKRSARVDKLQKKDLPGREHLPRPLRRCGTAPSSPTKL
jgi:hypothetical protein